MNIEKLSESIASGTISFPSGLNPVERLAFINNRLKELGYDETVKPLRKYDPEATMSLIQEYIAGIKPMEDIEGALREHADEAIKNA